MPRNEDEVNMPRKGGRVVLSQSDAVAIYQYKLARMVSSTYNPTLHGIKYELRGKSSRLGDKYGVSPKTIRDIWTHRSWREVTRPYWRKDPVNVVDLTTLCAELNATGAGGVTSAGVLATTASPATAAGVLVTNAAPATDAGVLVATATPATAAGVLMTSATSVSVVPVVWDWGQVATLPAAPAVAPWWNAANFFGVDNTLDNDWDTLVPLEDPFHGDWSLW